MGSDRGRSAAGWSEAGARAAQVADDRVDDAHPFATADARRYDRDDQVGAGGMGAVFAARDLRLQRRVALKQVAVEIGDAPAAERLAREAWIAANLEHPNIVPVYDAGRGDDGRLYYTMRLIRGQSLADALAERADVTARLSLLRHYLATCEAVAFAHSRGVVHRDLKPANVMVGPFGETQVVDWGLAAQVDETAAMHGVGTPGYRSPEQTRGAAPAPTADVWSLGVMLRELVTDAAAAPAELRAIADKATAADPSRRYPTAAELAVDVGDYLDGRRVSAHEYTSVQLAGRLVRAWRGPLVVAAVALVTLAILGVLSLRRMSAERSRAVHAESATRAALDTSDATLAWAIDRQAVAAHLDGALPEAEVLAAHALTRAESADARGVIAAAWASARPQVVAAVDVPACDRVLLGAATGTVLCVTPDSVAGWSLAPLAQQWRVEIAAREVAVVGSKVAVLMPGATLRVLDAATGAVHGDVPAVSRQLGLHASPDGRQLLSSNGGEVTLVDVETLARSERAHACGPHAYAQAMTVSARGFVVACSGGFVRFHGFDDSNVRDVRVPFGDTHKPAYTLRLADDGSRLLIGSVDGHVASVQVADGSIIGPISVIEGPVAALELVESPDVLAVLPERGGPAVWNLTEHAELVRLPASAGRLVAGQAGELVTVGTRLMRWRLALPLARGVFAGPAGLTDASVSADGGWIAAARGDGHVSVWSAATGRRQADVALSEHVVKGVSFDPGGRWIVTGVAGAAGVGAVSMETWQPLPDAGLARGVRRVGALTGNRAYALHYGPGVVMWRPGADAPRELPSPSFFDASASYDRRRAAFVADAGAVWVVGEDDALAHVLDAPSAVAVAIANDGTLAVALAGGVRVVPADGSPRVWLASRARDVLDVALSPNADFVAAATRAGTVEVWRVRDAALVAVLRGHRERVASVSFAGRGRLVSASWDGAVRVWNLDAALRAPDELVRDAERTWGLALDSALGAWVP